MKSKRIDVKPGQFFKTVMPHSEVCIHMQVAGKEMLGRLSEDGRSVQLFRPENSLEPFSFPILPGEAGLYSDQAGFYFYI